jgi:Fe-S-cluster-containing dehydrogenase component
MKLGLGAAVGAGTILTESGRIIAAAPQSGSDTRYAFLVDTTKCVGCGFCVKACKIENEIPYEANASRTWVERYLVMKDGSVYADSPKAGMEGFTSPVVSGYVTNDEGKVIIPHGGHGGLHPLAPGEKDVAKSYFVPKLCNQCDKPACVQVCPVGATYQTADGVVLVDRNWCIGCGYCIMSCPYGVRFFHPVHKVADKCTWCYHRITKGMNPACVDACAFGARDIGNLNDAGDPVAKIIKTERVQVLKPDYGTGPQAYYLGLDHEVR